MSQRELSAGELRPGERLGNYQVLERLGGGSMGVVYKTLNLSLGRVCVLKVLSARLAGDERVRARFLREGRAAGRLHYPHVVAVYDVGEAAGQYFIEMEYVPGGTLKDLISERAPLDALRAAAIVLQAAEAIAVAHDGGVTHRDLKPANILLTPEGQVKVADFGLAKDLLDTSQITSTGEAVGTPLFMAPEVFEGVSDDPRSDLYSLGVIFYLLLTGAHPFTAEELGAHVRQRSFGPPAPPEQVHQGVPAGASRVAMRLLAPRAQDRYPDGRSVADDLKALVALLRDQAGLQQQWLLLAFKGGGLYESHPLGGQPLAVGRGPGNTVRVADTKVSSAHFRIAADERKLVVEDLGSRNGTRLNGRVVQRGELRAGDLIQAGGALFLLQGPAALRGTRKLGAAGIARLEPVSGAAGLEPVALGSEGLTIGRAADADLHLADPAVSEYHAHLVLDGDRLYVHDLGSGTGTFAGGARIRRRHLRSGDSLCVGAAEFRFIVGDARPFAPPPMARKDKTREAILEPQPAPPPMARKDETQEALLEPEAPRPARQPAGRQAKPAAKAAVVACSLVVAAGPSRGKVIRIAAGPLVLGRGEGADVVLADSSLAEQHARIAPAEGGLEITDLGGGIAVNGKAVKRAALKPGDVVQLGSSRIEVRPVER